MRNTNHKKLAQFEKWVHFVPVFGIFGCIEEEINLMGNKINSVSSDKAMYIVFKPMTQQKRQGWGVWNMQNICGQDTEVTIYVVL